MSDYPKVKIVDLKAPARKIEWLLEGLIPLGCLSFLGALYGGGKTALAVFLCVQLARPRGEFLGIPLTQQASLYINFDQTTGDAKGVRHWLDKFLEVYKDADPDLITVVEPDGIANVTNEFLGSIAQLIQDKGVKLAVWDSFEACFPSVNPISAQEVRGVLFPIERMASDLGIANLILDHLPKPMKGEQAGERSLKGSTVKGAMARAVHILSTIPPQKVGGRQVFQWRVDKNSFGPKPEPFGVELRVEGDSAWVKPYDLPDEYQDSQLARAIRHLVAYLEERVGESVPRKELEQQAREAGVRSKSYIAKAIKAAVSETGAREVSLGGKGNPLAYLVQSTPLTMGNSEPNQENASSTAQDLVHTPVNQIAPVNQMEEPQREVLEI